MYLTRAEFEAGEPCRGCGEPLLDGLGREFVPLLRETPEQRAEREGEEARFRERHPDCHGGRWSMAGSRTLHCMDCCPPNPLSDKQIERMSNILGPKPDPADLDVWELALTCGHTARTTVHRTGSPTKGAVQCNECGGELFGIVTTAKVGPATEVDPPAEEEHRPQQPKQKQRKHDPSRAALRRRLREVEADAEALRLHLAQLDEPAAGT